MPPGLAFTPDCGQTAAGRLYNCPAEDEMRTALQKAIDNADYECGRRMNELDFATAFASPVKVAKKRAGAFNTVRLSSAAQLWIVDQRSNVDFKPLSDHFSALEYATKYATKQEKGSKAFDKMMALALNGGGRADPDKRDRSATGTFASFLVQQTGGRDWSAQEVAHVNMGIVRDSRVVRCRALACPMHALHG
jgi:hypothetical protein